MTGTACQSVNGGRSVDECDAVTVRCLRQVRTTLERRYSTVYQAEAATGFETAMSRRIRGPMDLVSGFDYTEYTMQGEALSLPSHGSIIALHSRAPRRWCLNAGSNR
jgi:hypothetical protein